MSAEKSPLPDRLEDPPAGENKINRKAVALVSGGLDSALAIHLVKKQGIDVTAVHFTSFFSPLDIEDEDSPVRNLVRQLKVPLVLRPKGRDFLELIRNPKHGHGKNLNPCVDCRIYTLVKARELMEEIGASFLVTGEVAGQRPMSQRKHTIRFIEKQAGCDGIVVRPLSAQVLPESLPEKVGVLDRGRFLGISGRGRKIQLKMAEEIGLQGYSTPAGGCLLTDKIYSRRLQDLLDDTNEPSQDELDLLRFGRHIRLRAGLKIVVCRNEKENVRLERSAPAGVMFFPVGFPGPLVWASGRPEPEEETRIASILRRYSRPASRGDLIGIRETDAGERQISVTDVAEDDWIEAHMIR
ncbi:MAG: hypothetical protein RDU20_12065 [Desulfomonilaceae bacterium]|nr:hypothetical protein [Desulfomonilaceae bacterium]